MKMILVLIIIILIYNNDTTTSANTTTTTIDSNMNMFIMPFTLRTQRTMEFTNVY